MKLKGGSFWNNLQDCVTLWIIRESIVLEDFAFEELCQVVNVNLLCALEKIFLKNLNVSCFSSILEAHVSELIQSKLTKDEEQELCVIFLERQVFLECHLHLLHDRELLCGNETLQHHSNRHVNVNVLNSVA